MGFARPSMLWKVFLIVGVLASLCVGITACGGSGSSSSSGSTTPATSEGESEGSSSESGYDEAKVEAILTAASAPAKWVGPKEPNPATPDKKITLIPTFAAAEGLQLFDEGVEDAAQALGWKVTLVDGKGTPQGYAAGVSQAITEGADGVVLGAIAPTQIPQELKQLKAAGIPVVDYGTVEEPTEELWLGNIGLDVPKEAEMLAASIAKESNGEAKLMVVVDKEYSDGNERTKFFLEDLKELCPGCEIVNETEMTVTEIETKLAPKIGSVLQANPEVNMIFSPFDAAVTPMIQAIKQAGLQDQVKIVSRGGFKQSTEYLRKKEIQVATIGEATQWIGWAALDTLQRHWNELPITEEVTKSDPLKLLTWDNAPKPGEYFEGEEAEYKRHYEELWGI
jgi:ribose transport system substrate-binding protein